jgi:hypothetical protein
MIDFKSSKNVKYYATGVIMGKHHVKEYESNVENLKSLTDYGMMASIGTCLEKLADAGYVMENDIPHAREEETYLDGTMVVRLSLAVVNPEYLVKLEEFWKKLHKEDLEND